MQSGLQSVAVQMIEALIESGSIPEQTRKWTCKISVQLFAPADYNMDLDELNALNTNEVESTSEDIEGTSVDIDDVSMEIEVKRTEGGAGA
jgi:hypothetical protein